MSDEVLEVPPAILAEAKADGWAEKETWRGPPELWVDAVEFVRRKNTVLPLLRKENGKLHTALTQTQAQLAGLEANMNEFVKYQQEQTLAALANQRKALLAEKRVAEEAGNDDQVVRIENELEENQEARQAAKEVKPAKPAAPQPQAEPPELVAWRNANPWFGSDHRKTGLAMGLGREATVKGLTGQDYFDFIDKEMKDVLTPEPRGSKTEGGGPSGSGAGGAPKGGKYASLPADAKAQCDADAKRFVGENKMFKTPAAWNEHFCKLFYGE